jgi:hypothetical protein
MSAANEMVPDGISRLAASLRAIEDMWPDDHDAMHTPDWSNEQAFSPGTWGSGKRLSASQLPPAAHVASVHRALADMWPDEHEVMLAFGET